MSVAAAAIAGFCFWKAAWCPLLLVIAPVLCDFRLWCNMLDGMVAVTAGKASARGEILNDLPDRASDVLIFAGVAESGLVHPAIGYWAAILAVFTAYVGLVGQAVGGRRQFGGIMSKPWRMVALQIGAWTTALLLTTQKQSFFAGGFTILDWTCLIVIAGCVQTIIVRLRRIMADLAQKPN
jgi:phosphatidylglycerophosphate synthase